MKRCRLKIVCALALALIWPVAAHAQASSPEALAAAKELMIASKASDQIRAILPMLVQNLKPAIVQGRPEVERAYDALTPAMVEAMSAQLDKFLDAAAIIYARNFTAEEMREITAFYARPTGQKLLQKLPTVMQESMTLGQQFGQIAAQDFHEQMVKELRKRGHNI